MGTTVSCGGQCQMRGPEINSLIICHLTQKKNCIKSIIAALLCLTTLVTDAALPIHNYDFSKGQPNETTLTFPFRCPHRTPYLHTRRTARHQIMPIQGSI